MDENSRLFFKERRGKIKWIELTLTVKVMVSPTSCGSSHSKCTRQLLGRRYLPVTYWRSECLASGARAGCVIAARVTSPATDTETTSIPPENPPMAPRALRYIYTCRTLRYRWLTVLVFAMLLALKLMSDSGIVEV